MNLECLKYFGRTVCEVKGEKLDEILVTGNITTEKIPCSFVTYLCKLVCVCDHEGVSAWSPADQGCLVRVNHVICFCKSDGWAKNDGEENCTVDGT